MAVRLDVDVRGEGSLNRLNRSLGNTQMRGSRLNTIFQSLGSLDFFLNLARQAGEFARSFATASDSITNVNNQLRAAGVSAGDLVAIQEQVRDVANATRQPYEATGQLIARIQRSTADLGISQQEVLDIATGFQQSLALSGATTTEAASAALQFGQALASGRLQGDELRSILENNSVFARALADELGVGVGELRELGAEGALTSEILADVALRIAPDMNERFAELMPTLAQATTVFTNGLQQAQSDIVELVNQSGFIQTALISAGDTLEALFGGEANAFRDLPMAIQNALSEVDLVSFGSSILGAVSNAIIGGLDFFNMARDRLTMALMNLEFPDLQEVITGLFSGVDFMGLGEALEETVVSTFNLLFAVGGTIVGLIQNAFNTIDFEALGNSLLSILTDRISMITNLFNMVDLGDIGERFVSALTSGLDLAATLLSDVSDFITMVDFSMFTENLFTSITNAITSFFSEFGEDDASGLGDAVVNAITSALSTFFAIGGAFAELIAGAFDGVFAGLGFDVDLSGFISNINDAVQDIFSGTFDWSGFIGGLTNGLIMAASDFVNYIIEQASQIVSALNPFSDVDVTDLNPFSDVTDEDLFGGRGLDDIDEGQVFAQTIPRPSLKRGDFLGTKPEAREFLRRYRQGIAGLQTGGLVRGPGSGTSDSILARLSNGEFVVNAEATRQYLPLLEELNGGSIPRYQNGGLLERVQQLASQQGFRLNNISEADQGDLEKLISSLEYVADSSDRLGRLSQRSAREIATNSGFLVDNSMAVETNTEAQRTVAETIPASIGRAVNQSLRSGDFSSFFDSILDSVSSNIIDQFSANVTDVLGMLNIFGGSGFGSGFNLISSLFGGIFHDGGVVPGVPGSTVPILAQAGERIVPRNARDNSSGDTIFNINIDGDVSRQTREEVNAMIPQLAAQINAQNRRTGATTGVAS